MTHRLYYTDSFLYEFDAQVTDVVAGEPVAVVLDQTAFYPTSGGQIFDTGVLVADSRKLRVNQVLENEQGEILHYLEGEAPSPGTVVRGSIDAERRRDHMQQHSGQHVLSAAFIKLFDMPTVSFHMGAESCAIDLDVKSISDEQLHEVGRLANQVVMGDRPVEVRFVGADEVSNLGLRKVPAVEKDTLRLIEVRDFDLTACGGTHVAHTSQIGPISIRKTEKVRQGVRVEFVCGWRALRTARRDFDTLTNAAALYSAHIWDVPQQIRKSLDEARGGQKERHRLLEELAEFWAGKLAAEAEAGERWKLVKHIFADRDLPFIKLLAQKLTAMPGMVALLGSSSGQCGVVFARSRDVDVDVSTLMKEAMAATGGGGGGSKELAQGGAPDASQLVAVIDVASAQIKKTR